MQRVVTILNLVLAAVLVGIMTVIWSAYNPSDLAASAYVDHQQAMIRALNTPMPVLGAATILLTLVSVYFRRSDRASAVSLAAAGVLFIAAGVVTRFCNQPINAVVMTWQASAPPANWELLRDQWWRWHIVRTVLATLALILLVFGHRAKAGPTATHG